MSLLSCYSTTFRAQAPKSKRTKPFSAAHWLSDPEPEPSILSPSKSTDNTLPHNGLHWTSTKIMPINHLVRCLETPPNKYCFYVMIMRVQRKCVPSTWNAIIYLNEPQGSKMCTSEKGGRTSFIDQMQKLRTEGPHISERNAQLDTYRLPIEAKAASSEEH